MKPLFQDQPVKVSTYTRFKNRSFTDSLESYKNGAYKQLMVLRWNKRTPTKEIVLHFLKTLSSEEIIDHRTRIFRYLKEHKIEAVASIELTKGHNNQPNNCVHFHILTDDTRSEKILRELFNTACEHADLARGKDFRIDYKPLWNGHKYLGYFTKYDYADKVILFQTHTGLHKFYQIGKWFHKSKELIWGDVKAWLHKKYGTDVEERDNPDYDADPDENGEQLKDDSPKNKSETKPSQTPHQAIWEPADRRKLKQELDKETNYTLYDWYCILLDQPTLFRTIPPRWLVKALPKQPLKRNALLIAIENRLKHSRNREFVSTLDFYFGGKDDLYFPNCPPFFLPIWVYVQNRQRRQFTSRAMEFYDVETETCYCRRERKRRE